MKEYLQWHPAFFAHLKTEFSDEREKIELESEHNISSKPMQIDVLIRKRTNEILQQNIGRLFKKYNIIEYKSPEDYLGVDDYYKVYGYACFYKSDSRYQNEIAAKDITLTFVCRRYPKKLIRYLQREKHLIIEEQEEGIYYINGEEFSIQLVVTSRLSEKKNFWLKYLTNDIKNKETAEKITQEYAKHQGDELYKSMMDVIVNANKELFKEVKKNMMCNALRELFKEELEEAAAKAAAKAETKAAAKAEAAAEAAAAATAAATEAATEKVQSTMCREIDQILERCGMDTETSVAKIREYIAAKRAGKSGNEVIV